MKKLIGILMMASLPAMAMSPAEALKTLESHGIQAPTVLQTVEQINFNPTGATSAYNTLLSGLQEGGSFYLNTGSTNHISDDSGFFGYGQQVNVDNDGFTFDAGSGTTKTHIGGWSTGNYGNLQVLSDAGSGAYGGIATFDVAWQAFLDRTDVATGDDNVLDSMAGGVGDIILNKAKELKPVMRNMAYQSAASSLGQGAFIACDDMSSYACAATGDKLSKIANNLGSASGIISEDNVVYQGDTWYRDFHAVPWWGSTDADTRLGIYRLRNADGSWRMETRATGSYIRGWNEANTDTGHGWSPEVNHATVYNDNLDAIGDLTDALITLDGETFGDIFTE